MSLEEISPEGEAMVFDGDGDVGPYTGSAMTPWQYEALCRHAISREYGVPISEIQTGTLKGAQRPRKTSGTRSTFSGRAGIVFAILWCLRTRSGGRAMSASPT